MGFIISVQDSASLEHIIWPISYGSFYMDHMLLGGSIFISVFRYESYYIHCYDQHYDNLTINDIMKN